jgi:peptidoglycan/xylan/chitin deacetylase (PgdA/CDA1 family)
VGDAGGRFGRTDVAHQIASAPNGSVILVHMNKPRGATREGLRDALPKLRERGVELVRLDQVTLR